MKKILYIIIFILNINIIFADYNTSFGKLNSTDKEIVNKINTFFDSMLSLKSDFIQFNKKNIEEAKGIFYVKKPDNFKIEYTGPFRKYFIITKKLIKHYDYDLDEFSVLPKMNNDLFDLFIQQRNLESLNAEIIKIVIINENIYIYTKIISSDKENIISLTLVFDKTLKKLLSFDFQDKENDKITLKFINMEINLDLSNDLFKTKESNFNKNKRF